jgi:chloramphenicol 3-O-phosphotransferase
VRPIGRETDERGSILIVTGPAASGKTSAARLLAERSTEPSVHLHGDDFFRALKVGRLRGWEEGAVPQHEVVFDAMARAVTSLARGGYFVVLDSLIRPRYLGILTDIISTNDVALHYVVLRPSWTIVQERSDLRDETWRHDAHVLRVLHDVFDDLGELESHVLDNTALDEDETVSMIQAKMARGDLLI